MATPDLDRVAEVLRWADLALSQSTASLIAFVPSTAPAQVDRACERNQSVQQAIKEVLADLPPEPPQSSETTAECLTLISQAMCKRGW